MKQFTTTTKWLKENAKELFNTEISEAQFELDLELEDDDIYREQFELIENGQMLVRFIPSQDETGVNMVYGTTEEELDFNQEQEVYSPVIPYRDLPFTIKQRINE